ncbi:hypothetical protein Bca52824_090462 [Brassica carinata]|uniref:Cyclin-like domain-containing protein n=1 Tax=Brassica carinata TaxID=52824 RepID=A0A8X7NXZ0_BRACI|nr:hypothetical protein Bca52824_090462 [Brassica carinata]
MRPRGRRAPNPIFARSSLSFSGHLAELERTLEVASNSTNSSSTVVVVDNLRAYMQIVDVASILGLHCDISEHAFELFRDCCSATCLRNRSVEALATACLVQAIREAQEPPTLQDSEISIASNVQQKEIGKVHQDLRRKKKKKKKILGEALQLGQPINSNSISVHMPRFLVINKCFCTRRNPISISAAAIYLACQLEDKRKTQAEICKITRDKPSVKPIESLDNAHQQQSKGKEDKHPKFRRPWLFGTANPGDTISEPAKPSTLDFDKQQLDKQQQQLYDKETLPIYLRRQSQFPSNPSSSSGISTINWTFRPSGSNSGFSTNLPAVHPPKLPPGYAEIRATLVFARDASWLHDKFLIVVLWFIQIYGLIGVTNAIYALLRFILRFYTVSFRMDEIWEKAVETALGGETEPETTRVLTLDGAVKCAKGLLPRPGILEKYPNLEHLSIAGVGVSSLDRFPRLGKLQKLVLSDNRISGGLEFLVRAGLGSLRDLDLSNNRIGLFEDLLPLAELELVSLDLYKCPVTKMRDYRARVFGLVKSLKYLDKMDAEENEIPESDDEEEEDDDDDEEEGDDGDDGEERRNVISNGRSSEVVVEVDEEESGADDDDGDERPEVMSNGRNEEDSGADDEERPEVMSNGHSEGADEEESGADDDDDGEERPNLMRNGRNEGVVEGDEEESGADDDDGDERPEVMSNGHSEGVDEEESGADDDDGDDGDEERPDVMSNGRDEEVVEGDEEESGADDDDGDDGEERPDVMSNRHGEGVVEGDEEESGADDDEGDDPEIDADGEVTVTGRQSNELRDEHLNMDEEDDDDDSDEEDDGEEDEYEPDGLLVDDTNEIEEEVSEGEEEMEHRVSGLVANGAQNVLMNIDEEENDESGEEDEYEPDGLLVDDTHEIEEEDGVEEMDLGVQHGNELLRNILVGEIEHEQEEDDDDESWEEEEEEEEEEEHGTGGRAQSMAEAVQVDEEDSDDEVQALVKRIPSIRVAWISGQLTAI